MAAACNPGAGLQIAGASELELAVSIAWPILRRLPAMTAATIPATNPDPTDMMGTMMTHVPSLFGPDIIRRNGQPTIMTMQVSSGVKNHAAKNAPTDERILVPTHAENAGGPPNTSSPSKVRRMTIVWPLATEFVNRVRQQSSLTQVMAGRTAAAECDSLSWLTSGRVIYRSSAPS